MKIIKITQLLSFLAFGATAVAGMAPMNEADLSATYGQAIFEVKEQAMTQADGSALDMLRLTMGAKIEINANIEEIALGRYWRPEGTNCSGGAGGDKVCYNNNPPISYNDNINWACTANPCGSVGLAAANYLSSGLTHNVGEESFFDTSVFPSGFKPDSGVDIKLRDVTMGQVRDDDGDGIYELTPFVQQNPYFEFAFDQDTGKIVGFRLGAEDSYGYQGNAIDVISGFIRPTITVDAKLGFIDAGVIQLETQLGGVRTIGWIDAKTTNVISVSGAAGLLVNGPESLMGQSPHAQLFPVQSNYLNHSEAFFLSAGTRSINWTSVRDGGFTPAATMPGFWLNMGGDGGLLAETQKGDHPNNYFPGHPKNLQYSGMENYNNPQPSWSQTYQ